MKKYFDFNFNAFQELAVGFSRSTSPVARGIQLFRGILRDPAAPNHAFFTTHERGQWFACEETVRGLCETSIDKYLRSDNRIVAMYYWTGWDDIVIRDQVLDWLTYIRRKQGDRRTHLGKYDKTGIFSFVPGFRRLPWFQPDPEAEWCSENASSLHAKYCRDWSKELFAPDALLKYIQSRNDCKCILGYYK